MSATNANGQAPPKPPSVRYGPNWYNLIPQELRERAQWVVWRYAIRKGKNGQPDKWTKEPYRARNPHKKASTTNRTTWDTFDVALAAFLDTENRLDGIGYVFCADDPFVGWDIDNCIGPDGKIADWAQPHLERLTPTYAEISPSGNGVKGFSLGSLPGDGTRRAGFGIDQSGALEFYDRGRFFTTTG